MGAACCFQAEYEDLTNPNSTVYRNCFCLGGFLQNFVHMYSLLIQRGDEHGPSSSSQGMRPMTSTSSTDNSLVNVFRSPPRPMPYDTDPRNFHLQQEGIGAKREKASTNQCEETEPLRNVGDVSSEFARNNLASGEVSKYYNPEISLQPSAAKTSTTYLFDYTDSLYDECPTCLEEYTIDNPKIITKCSHHFHLGCIFEWMERSDKCPVCGKVMVFDEAI